MVDATDARLQRLSDRDLMRAIARVRGEEGKWANEAERRAWLTLLEGDAERRQIPLESAELSALDVHVNLTLEEEFPELSVRVEESARIVQFGDEAIDLTGVDDVERAVAMAVRWGIRIATRRAQG